MNTRRWKWTKSEMVKHQDTIKSSEYCEMVPFVPSYEYDKIHPNMFDLLSMEYGKIWQREMKEAQIIPLLRQSESKPILTRPQVIRTDQKKVVNQKHASSVFRMKKFLNVPAKVNSFRKKENETEAKTDKR